ncbi:unnamed protein product [Bursaphelenchus xylophilus]|uniref:legumain n=1 Tax=Bursaphelenchus xylophilus TaxID=6326 RepID=A0A1I7SFV3_BURXY|nr:unnamed protein product [Bursaphelenchus xylophilus]CAG9106335.1 unnamed protein product [Bursaphelenchus xylophilus]
MKNGLVLLVIFLCLAVEIECALFAVLVSGSRGWENYRHQADVCNAYRVITAQGVEPDNIITMVYDDIANDPRNPFPGKIFNSGDLDDVYSGIKIDYRGDDVNVANFQKILLGIPTGVGSGRVLNSTIDDNVFVYFSNHGNTGFVGFPNHQIFTAKELHVLLDAMKARNRYGKMLVYIESCFSGSLFNGILREDRNIYALTASNERESSYGTTDSIQDKTGTRIILGDAFSANWINSMLTHDLTATTIDEQFEFVQEATKLSHVQRFGTLSIGQMKVAEFLQIAGFREERVSGNPKMANSSMPSCVMPELIMIEQFEKTQDLKVKAELGKKLRKIIDVKHSIEKSSMELFVALFPTSRADKLSDPTMDPRLPPHKITQLDCHDKVVHGFAAKCPEMMDSDFKNHFIATITNLCERMVPAEEIAEQMEKICR